ncbi:MAG: 4Fe-4S binding protein [Clostridiales Family XIII bacterium]|jgi:dissimilatory sulfite reductase (desulfoviridin) alpha/beta subunit|nr:4Fe-4S binding protein [Clostridiales Family XIII bacterium]
MEADYAALKRGGFMRQVQKNRFSLRLKVVGGNLTAEQIETVARVARAFGKGYVHLTSRQGVEIPFIRLEDVNAVQEALRAGGVDTGVCGPRVRTVTACQGASVCPSGCIETSALAMEISARYYGRSLPHKFKFGVTGCQNNCLKAEENDVGVKGAYIVRWIKEDCTLCGVCLKACRENALSERDGEIVLDAARCTYCGRCAKSCPTGAWRGESAYLLSFGGMFGNRIAKGRAVLPAFAEKERLFRVTDAALDFFDANAREGERFRAAIERGGWSLFENKVTEAYNGEI